MANLVKKRRKTFQVSMTIVVDEEMDSERSINEANVESVLDNGEWLSKMFHSDVDIEDVSSRLLDKDIITTDEEYEDGIDTE